MLREDFLPDYELTASSFAKAIGISRQTVNELLRERRASEFRRGWIESIFEVQ